MLRSLTAIAVAYLLIGALVMALRLAWSLLFGATPTPLLWLGWTLLAAAFGGYAVGFITGRSPLGHAAGLAAVATVLAFVTLFLPAAAMPRDYRLGLLLVMPIGIMAGGLLRRSRTRRL